MRLDADPETDGIQTFLRVSVDQPFRVGLDVTKIGPSNYQGYGWLISFADAELSFLSRTENTAATQLPACAATPNVGYEPGISRIYSGCYTTNPDGVNFVGEITTLELQCRTAGSFALRLLDVVDDPGFGSGLIDHNGLVLSTGTFDITVECNGIASCVSFDPGACDPSATPTPPGPDAQTATAIAIRTATAIAGPPNPPTNTPTAIATATPVPTSTATARPTGAVCADVTGDGRVTARDVSAIAAHIFGRYQPRYDLNDDGRVNQQDVKIASAQLGRRC